MVQLRYFASLREKIGVAAEQVELPAQVGNIQQLTDWLQARDARWQAALSDPRLLTARNQAMVPRDTPVTDGDEIAWFPPVTGG